MPQSPSPMSPVVGYAIHALHAARQRGATLEAILIDINTPDPVADAEMEADQVATTGAVFAPATDVRVAIRLLALRILGTTTTDASRAA